MQTSAQDSHASDRRAGRVWLITGASSGLGYAFAEAALAAGDRVAGLARHPAALDALATHYPGRVLKLAADVTDRQAVFASVGKALEAFGRLDIVVNNAGQLLLGMVEELSESEARALMEVNFFGALWVSQAVTPVLRAQASGHLIQVSSIAALGGFPMTGIYSASKVALEGLSEALAQELAEFGARLTIVEPGGYWTPLYLRMQQTEPLQAYAALRHKLAQSWAEGAADSDPRLAAAGLMKLVDSPNPPLRLLLGSLVYDLANELAAKRQAERAEWEAVSRAAEQAVPPPAGYAEAAQAKV